MKNHCKANPCCGDPYECKVPLPQHRSGLWFRNSEEYRRKSDAETIPAAPTTKQDAIAESAEEVKPVETLRDNDAVWAAFYRDDKNLGEICAEFDCSVYDLSPWLMAPLMRHPPADAALLEEAVRALEPFAQAVQNADETRTAYDPKTKHMGYAPLGNFFAARAALEKIKARIGGGT